MAKTLNPTLSKQQSFSSHSAAPAARAAALPRLALSYRLSGLLAVITLAAAAGSFFIPDLFRLDHPALAGCARGTALVMLALAVPLLLGAMILSARGSLRARLVWLGMTGYILYNSFYFAFSASFNRLFLLYVAMLGLAAWSLLTLLHEMDLSTLSTAWRDPAFARRMPVRVLAVLVLFPIPLIQFSLSDFLPTLQATLAGITPQSVAGTQMPSNHFAILNLAFLLPLISLAAVWLWQRRAWGYLLAGTMLSYYAIELLGIASDQVFGSMADSTSPHLASLSAAPVFVVMALFELALLVVFLHFLRWERD